MSLRTLVFLLTQVLLASCGESPTPSPGKTIPRPPTLQAGGSAAEKQFAALVSSHPGQKRNSMVWDSRLHAAARVHARDMAERNFFNHVNPDGHGPNWRVTQSGYRLPIKWTAFKDSNQVESILAGYESPSTVFEEWLGSKKHRSHLLGLIPTYQNQSRFGVARVTVPGSTYKNYWVFVSAPPESPP